MSEDKREEVEFSIVREKWNEYRFENEIKCKLRFSPTKILTSLPGDKPGFQNISIVYAITTNFDKEEELSKIPAGKLITFETVEEPMNIYDIGHAILVVVNHLETVSKTDKIDLNNKPVFNWGMKISASPVSYPKF